MELIGQRFGHIRVTGVVGQGGMGEVYAGYDEKLERKVAVKVLNADQRLDLEAKERLLREARALSRLDHPNICRIHDYIESGDVDLLVLEYIDGKTLGELMSEHLSRGERLRIAMAIASVLVAAHRTGILHRDLKPDNVMLTKSGEVKVLDFGLARWLQHRKRGGSSGGHKAVVVGLAATRGGDTMPLPNFERAPLATAAGITLGTPLYMSPEQARGEELTPASDLFSFGLLLQALFSGDDPHPMGLSAREIILRVARGETNPVTKAPGDVAALINRLKQFAPADRPTAVEAVERLRFLINKPTRIVRRAIAAVLVAIAAIGAWRYTVDLKRERAIALQAQQEAEHSRAQSEEFMNYMVGDLRKKLEPLGSLDVLDDVGKRALDYVDSLHTESMPAESIARNVKALNQLGEVRIGQGKLAEAMVLFRRSLALAAGAVRREPASPDAQLALATSNFWIGDVYRQQGKLDDALRHYTIYMNGAERLAKAFPGKDDYLLERGYGHSVVASIYERQGDLQLALDHLRLTREIKEARLNAKPGDVDRQSDLARTLNRIGFVLERSGDLQAARQFYAREFTMYTTLAAREPRNTRWKDRLVTSNNFLARLFEMTGDVKAALAHRRAELDLIRLLAARDPQNTQWQRNLAICAMNYGNTLRLDGDAAGALASTTEAETILQQLLRRPETVWSWQRDLGSVRTATAWAHLALGNAAAAQRSAESSVQLIESAAQTDMLTPQYLAASYLALGESSQRRGDASRARAAFTRAAEVLGAQPAESRTPVGLDVLARAYLRLGRANDAQPIIQRLKATGYQAPDFINAVS